ncbi:type VI secretion system protein TssA [Paraburkholderia lycopersici]|uniref:Type VI secretion system protein ImpA n=1 Tax=Paraburkholderia lycopersici TaxID=416944 RepID=A0A1G6XTQ9_9BURK|nr:type VI secretion system protein TssA [Paraburkholderia lycopersici]SDD81568.1 type VI secretion system protein ImpA [Paraburkholderia lycopersici]
MATSLEDLLPPISADQPCGVNLEYDADFHALEQAATGKPEQQYGGIIIAAEAPDWLLVERLASALLTRTKDLRVMIHLCLAWTHLRDLRGYLDGLNLLEQTLTQYGSQVFPQFDIEGEPDPYLRINALAALGDQAVVGEAVQTAIIVRTTGGEISLRDACALLDRSRSECPGFPGGRAQLVDELSKTDQPACQTIRALASGIARLRDSIVRMLGEEGLPEMGHLLKCMTALAEVGARVDAKNASGEFDAGPSGQAQTSGSAGTPALQDGRIRCREEALAALRRVQEYFREHEPGHPAPLMLERVQRVIAMNFLEILEDLAPDCLGPVRNILGTSDPIA